jgi:hypothetical protein
MSASYCQRALLGESGIIRTRMGTHNRLGVVAVYGTPCAIPPINSKQQATEYVNWIHSLFNDVVLTVSVIENVILVLSTLGPFWAFTTINLLYTYRHHDHHNQEPKGLDLLACSDSSNDLLEVAFLLFSLLRALLEIYKRTINFVCFCKFERSMSMKRPNNCFLNIYCVLFVFQGARIIRLWICQIVRYRLPKGRLVISANHSLTYCIILAPFSITAPATFHSVTRFDKDND